jgi:hypothetical protein
VKTPIFLIALSFLVLSSFASSAFAVNGIDDNDHAMLAKYYEDQANEVKEKLQENKQILEDYEEHSFYYGRQGQDVQSHATANIREYEKLLTENLSNAELHKRIAMEQDKVINKAKLNVDNDSAIQ